MVVVFPQRTRLDDSWDGEAMGDVRQLDDLRTSSSRKSTPWCASEISPGQGGLPPPTKAAALALWCGARNGRCRQRFGSSPSPLTDATAASCSASVSSMPGSRLGRREASRVLPQPGLPISSML